MPGPDYPPTRRIELGAALARLEEQLDDIDEEIERHGEALEDGDGGDGADGDDIDREAQEALQEARTEQADLQPQRKALHWLIYGDEREDGFDGYGEDAEIVVQAYTAGDRSRVVHTLNQTRMGGFGTDTLEDWLIAAGVDEAPWLDGGEDLQTRAEIVEDSLPPALRDWLGDQLEDIGDLSAPTEGN